MHIVWHAQQGRTASGGPRAIVIPVTAVSSDCAAQLAVFCLLQADGHL